MNHPTPIRRALLSVSDKAGLADLARVLAAHGAELLSTGGTARALREAGVAVVDLSTHTGFPEILDGRVKTLVPQVHGGILGIRSSADHVAQMAEHGIAPIDLVVVNLYPFAATVAGGAGFDDCVEQIDIGGPALIRAAAKNHAFVAVLTDVADYAALRQALESDGGTSLAQRRDWASSAFAYTAAYDAAVAAWFARQRGDDFPATLSLAATGRRLLRYGENPHQAAAFYATGEAGPGIATARLAQGKELSFNNLADADAAIDCAAEFEPPTAVIVKHANPCGVGSAGSLLDAWRAALAGDPVAAFGGVVALNRSLDAPTAEAIGAIFTEVVIAPDASPEALAVLGAKPNLRLLLTGGMPDPARTGIVLRTVGGGLLAQRRDAGGLSGIPRVVTRRAPSDTERQALLFAWTVCKHVKSNAIVIAQGHSPGVGATLGIGAGQMSRLDAARLAVRKARDAGHDLAGSVVASDAFFPFADGLVELIEAGATAAIQPGGSLRDAAVIAAADAAGVAMLFTAMRHFRH